MASSGKDKQAVRLSQLNKLRAAHPNKNDAEFAALLGVDPTYYSRLKSYPKRGSKKIGDKCREWEVSAGLPVGWFDLEDGVVPQTEETLNLTEGALRVAMMWDSLGKEARLQFERDLRKAAFGGPKVSSR
jgi:hypothetical protein